MSDARNVPERRRFEVALQGEGGKFSLWSPVELDHEPRKGDVITLADVPRAEVLEVVTGEDGRPVIHARRLSSS